jgi:hypothetical protein
MNNGTPLLWHVRFGSLADICTATDHVHPTSESRHRRTNWNVRKGLQADIPSLFDYVVGLGKQ